MAAAGSGKSSWQLQLQLLLFFCSLAAGTVAPRIFIRSGVLRLLMFFTLHSHAFMQEAHLNFSYSFFFLVRACAARWSLLDACTYAPCISSSLLLLQLFNRANTHRRGVTRYATRSSAPARRVCSPPIVFCALPAAFRIPRAAHARCICTIISGAESAVAESRQHGERTLRQRGWTGRGFAVSLRRAVASVRVAAAALWCAGGRTGGGGTDTRTSGDAHAHNHISS
jgi:hypothetical protein